MQEKIGVLREEEEGDSDTFIIKQNLTATEIDTTEIDTSIPFEIGTGNQIIEIFQFHSSSTTLGVGDTEEEGSEFTHTREQQVMKEVKGEDDIEFDENLMELLKYGDTQDLTLV